MLDRLLKKIQDNPDLISGIYNYCDRWCERCTFTSKCAQFALEGEEEPDIESRDTRNADFWKEFAGILAETENLIRETAEKEGVSLEEFVATDAQLRADECHRHRAMREERSLAAREYAKAAREWLESAQEQIRAKGVELEQVARLELPGESPAADASDIGDALAVVRWYHTQIPVKLMRAVHAKTEGVVERLADVVTGDSNGSAKVALIGMDRSIAAWGRLLRHFPDSEDDILHILVRLERLRRACETMFPKARSFKRPGFDDPRYQKSANKPME